MCPTSTASSACPTPRIGSITTSMSASPNCSSTFSPPPCQPRTECRPTHDRPPLGVVRQMAEVPGVSPWQRRTLVLVCTAVFMLLLDITVVSVALPSIQRDLRARLPDLQWVSAAYALVLAVLLLPAATLGDRLGRRRLFLVGLVIFTAGRWAPSAPRSAARPPSRRWPTCACSPGTALPRPGSWRSRSRRQSSG